MAGPLLPTITVRLTANFERNLDEIEAFLSQAEALQGFDALLDVLAQAAIPDLERFPTMGRAFLGRPIRSVEARNGVALLQGKLSKLGAGADIREYVLQHYLLLYAWAGTEVYLLSIRHHRQLSFDFEQLWFVA